MLVVDDNNFDIVRLVERGLKEHGFKVSAFTDPLLALEDFKVNGKVCSIILSDIRMPGMNGYEFVCFFIYFSIASTILPLGCISF